MISNLIIMYPRAKWLIVAAAAITIVLESTWGGGVGECSKG